MLLISHVKLIYFLIWKIQKKDIYLESSWKLNKISDMRSNILFIRHWSYKNEVPQKRESNNGKIKEENLSKMSEY